MTSNSIINILSSLIIGILSSIIAAILIALWQLREFFLPYLLCQTFFRNKLLRISLATVLYLRDENDRYLLVRMRRRPEWFGPLGGVIKYYPSAQLEEKFEFQRYSGQSDLSDDLRGRLPGRHFVKFMRWFRSYKDREVESVTRELIEELKEIGLEDLAESIQALPLSLVRRAQGGIQRVSSKEDFYQFRYIEVYKLDQTNEYGRTLTENLFAASQHNAELITVTADEIKRRRARTGEAIGVHSGYLIGRERTGPEPPPF
ncbi:hypothetical protein [Candidatus Leptofilum sp.]|uniref:SMODS-associated NUDIX domain-containing protein n=1 Tax=Candidatus Leptofilum sp. TaxID=3241576 RepID=UPI003B5B33F2